MSQGGETKSSALIQTPTDEQGPGNDGHRADDLLEEALEESFPASDPVAANRFD